MVNPSWAEDSAYEEEGAKCVLVDCPLRRQRLDCQWEAAMMASPGNQCRQPEQREAWLGAMEEEGR